jgi:hypothetical protein
VLPTDPTVANIGQARFGKYRFVKGGRGISSFYGFVVPVLVALANAVNEIHYSDRLHPNNHGTWLLAKRFTAIVDCAPVFVRQPVDRFWQSLLFQYKYGACCLKIQVAINFLGWIVFYTGMHAGTETDDVIFDNTAAEHPFQWWEWWLGDAAYQWCNGVVTRFVQPAGGALWRDEVFMNAYLNHYRQYVEHVMHKIKSHNMWRSTGVRGSRLLIRACMHVTVHLTNVAIKRPWQPEFHCPYPGFHHGTPHFP